MARIIDYISLTIILFVLSFSLLSLAINNFAITIVIACSVTIIVVFSIYKLTHNKQNPYTYQRLELEMCIRGNSYIIELIVNVLNQSQKKESIIKNAIFENGSNYILLENSIIIANFKFSALNMSDISSACNLAIEKDKRKVFLLTKAIDRRAYQIAELKDVEINIVKSKQLFKFLKKHQSLPTLKKIKRKVSIKHIVDIALARSNLKYYAFSGVVLILSSFITPLRIYYIVFGAISLALAIITLTPLGHGNILSQKAFDEIEKYIND